MVKKKVSTFAPAIRTKSVDESTVSMEREMMKGVRLLFFVCKDEIRNMFFEEIEAAKVNNFFEHLRI